jgi:DNA-binding response OmpR family regulator
MSADLLSALLVDDDEHTSSLLELLFSEWGYRVTLAATATEGLRHLLERRFDIIVLDNWLPDLEGIELCRQIREFDRKTPIVFYSGATMGSEDARAFAAGANAYISKGAGLGSLREAMAGELKKADRKEEI